MIRLNAGRPLPPRSTPKRRSKVHPLGCGPAVVGDVSVCRSGGIPVAEGSNRRRSASQWAAGDTNKRTHAQGAHFGHVVTCNPLGFVLTVSVAGSRRVRRLGNGLTESFQRAETGGPNTDCNSFGLNIRNSRSPDRCPFISLTFRNPFAWKMTVPHATSDRQEFGRIQRSNSVAIFHETEFSIAKAASAPGSAPMAMGRRDSGSRVIYRQDSSIPNPYLSCDPKGGENGNPPPWLMGEIPAVNTGSGDKDLTKRTEPGQSC